jgi:hypothetical protein
VLSKFEDNPVHLNYIICHIKYTPYLTRIPAMLWNSNVKVVTFHMLVPLKK